MTTVSHIFKILFQAVFMLVPGIALFALGSQLETEQGNMAIALMGLGAIFLLGGAWLLFTYARDTFTTTMMGHLQHHIGFDERTLKHNRAGKLTWRQLLSLSSSTLLRVFLAGALSLGMAAAAYTNVQQPNQGIISLVVSGIISVMFAGYAVNALYKFYADVTSGIRQIDGYLSAYKRTRETHHASRGSRRITTHYLKVNPIHAPAKKIPDFPVSMQAYKAIQSQTDKNRYRVYYLPAMQHVLSLEVIAMD